MWAAHLAELCCPACRGPLSGVAGEGWIENGALACAGCRMEFPIDAGVPRLLVTNGAAAEGPRVDPRTQAAFGFEWLRYPVTSEAEDLVTLVGLTGVDPEFYRKVAFRNLFAHEPSAADVAATDPGFFRSRRVLEGGCGMGKYVAQVARAGARLAVGLDASEAVRRAAGLNRERTNALIVQGDLFAPPLAGPFDFVYSVGVLHHTPDARRAFLSIARLVGPQGALAVWLYPHAGDPARQIIELWHERIARPLLSRMSHPRLERLCARLGRWTALKTRLRQRGGFLREAAARLINLVAVGEHRDPAIAAFLNFDWYSPPYRSRHTAAELAGWYREAGFATPRALPVEVSAIGHRP